MTSIYQAVLGDEFDRLHPKMRWRFGFSSADGTCQIGTGVMDDVWRGPWWTLPFLLLGSTRRVLFPSRGRDVPFTIANYAYVDGFGRESVTWSRRFRMPRRIRAFDATMIHSPSRELIIDYLGTHQHLAVDIHCSVDDDGALCIRTGDQRFYEGPVAFRFPMLLTGVATVLKPRTVPNLLRGRRMRGMPVDGSWPNAARRPAANDAYTSSGSGTATMTLPVDLSGSKSSCPNRWIWMSSRATTAYGLGRV